MSSLESLAASCRDHPIVRRRRNCGVYFLIDHYEIIYIGSSTDIETRLEQHFAGVPGRSEPKVFDRVLWIPLPAAVHADYEGAFIRALAPHDNMTAPASRGNDAEILDGFGLPPPPADPHAEWIRRLRAKTGRTLVVQ